MEGTSKGGRPRKRWRDVVEEDINMVGIKNRQVIVGGRRECWKIVVEAKGTTDCSTWGGVGGEWDEEEKEEMWRYVVS